MYDPSAVEPKWQKKWADAKAYEVDFQKAKKPFFTHVMFPYPSGDKLHVGHWYNFSPADSFARFKRMQGFDVFSPMGFDAFGLPAENYAIKTGVPPQESIPANITTMITQLKRIGCMYDWNRMVTTSHPEYYKWTQWLFLQMFKNDLAYKKHSNVNFCPKCQTVLANEQVWEGKCERCGTDVVQKAMEQWFWKTTKYAERLLNGLDDLDWPEKTKTMQRNWIGRSEGAEIEFRIKNSELRISVFTTRADTLFGATYLVLAPEHPFIDQITSDECRDAVNKYQISSAKKSALERGELNKQKTGEFTGAYAINPATNEEIPIWVADYVLVTYGTGAVMAVPAHDERDFEFANYHEMHDRIKCVVEPDLNIVNFHLYVHPTFLPIAPEGQSISDLQSKFDITSKAEVLEGKKCWTGNGSIISSDFLNGLSVDEAKVKMIQKLEKDKQGKKVTTYRLRDWSIGRQRYWGAPIPIVYDPEGNPHPVPEKHLPWMLPKDVEFKPKGTAPLAQSEELRQRTEKIFGKGWKPEVDTMDTFVCSSFYSFMYLSSSLKEGEYSHPSPEKNILVDDKTEKKWMPVSMYIGGAEHACMHLIYARFVSMVLKDLGFVSHEEQYAKLVHQGVITNKGAKMSKSKGNVVSPDSFVDRHGSDVFRMYLMFMGPFTEGGDWSDTGIKGVDRFVQRLWKLCEEKISDVSAKNENADVLSALHAAIKKVGQDIERLQFNTAIAALMELLNMLEKQESLSVSTMQTVARLLSPLSPHLAEEIWEKTGGKGFVIDQPWPEFDPKLLVSSTLIIAIQVNGKLRGTVSVPADMSDKEIVSLAKEEPNVKKFTEGSLIKKEIYVKGKLVNLVV